MSNLPSVPLWRRITIRTMINLARSAVTFLDPLGSQIFQKQFVEKLVKKGPTFSKRIPLNVYAFTLERCSLTKVTTSVYRMCVVELPSTIIFYQFFLPSPKGTESEQGGRE